VAVKLLFNELPQFVDANGAPYSGAKLFTYVAGSSTKQTTYQDSGAITANSNPIVCDSAGRVPYPIWGTTGVSYKLVLAPSTDTDPPTSPIFTIDNVTGINDTTVSIDQWVSGPTPTYVSATSFTLAGDQTGTFQVGRRVKTTNSGGTVYSTITASAYAALTTITVVNDSGSLDSGLSAVSYGLLSATNASMPILGMVIPLTSVSGTTTITATALTEAAPLQTGQMFAFTPASTNTGSTTVNPNSLGAKNLFSGGAACAGNELTSSSPVAMYYDGTRFNLIGGALSGDWTPAISFGGGTTGITYTTQVGKYHRFGNLVTCQMYIVLSSKGSSAGSLKITGLPFTSRNVSNMFQDFAFAVTAVNAGVGAPPIGQIAPNGTSIDVYTIVSGSLSAYTEGSLTSSSVLIGNFSYFI